MKRLPICFLVLIAGLFLLPARAFGQSSTAVRPTPEQSLQELVTEVRQLRATLQRMNAAVYKGQVILERLKLQQEQVSRINRELRDARDNLSDLRAQQSKMKEVLGRVEADIEKGVQRDADRISLKAELEVLRQREQRLAMRETELANELEGERAKLNELNYKLNMVLEHELSPR